MRGPGECSPGGFQGRSPWPPEAKSLKTALEELSHGEFKPSAVAVALAVLVQRDAVTKAQIAHGRTPAKFKAEGFQHFVPPLVGVVGVNVEADVKEGHQVDAKLVADAPKVFKGLQGGEG